MPRKTNNTPKPKDVSKAQANMERKEKSNKAIIGRSAFYSLLFRLFGGEVIFKSPKKNLSKKKVDESSKHFKLDVFSITLNGETIVDEQEVRNELAQRTREHFINLYTNNIEKGIMEGDINDEYFQNKIKVEVQRTLKQNVFDEINNRLIQWLEKRTDLVKVDCDKSKKCNKQQSKKNNLKLKMIVINLPNGSIRIEKDGISECGLKWLETANIPIGQGTFEVQSTPSEIETIFREFAIQQDVPFQSGMAFLQETQQISSNDIPMNAESPNVNGNYLNDFGIGNGNNFIQQEVSGNDINNAEKSLVESQSQQSSNFFMYQSLNQSSNQIDTIVPPPVYDEMQNYQQEQMNFCEEFPNQPNQNINDNIQIQQYLLQRYQLMNSKLQMQGFVWCQDNNVFYNQSLNKCALIYWNEAVYDYNAKIWDYVVQQNVLEGFQPLIPNNQ